MSLHLRNLPAASFSDRYAKFHGANDEPFAIFVVYFAYIHSCLIHVFKQIEWLDRVTVRRKLVWK